MQSDLITKFWSQVRKTETCWEWLGYRNPKGYGRTWFGTRRVLAHRLSYELENGVIPKGLVVDHVCQVRHCVNPHHLEAVTSGTNTRRAYARKTCAKGHLYVSGAQRCLICYKSYQRAYRAAERAKKKGLSLSEEPLQ